MVDSGGWSRWSRWLRWRRGREREDGGIGMVSGSGCEEGVDFGLYVGWALHEVGQDCVPVMVEEGGYGTMCVRVEGGVYSVEERAQGMVGGDLVGEVGPEVIVGIWTGVVIVEYFGNSLKVFSSAGMHRGGEKAGNDKVSNVGREEGDMVRDVGDHACLVG